RAHSYQLAALHGAPPGVSPDSALWTSRSSPAALVCPHAARGAAQEPRGSTTEARDRPAEHRRGRYTTADPPGGGPIRGAPDAARRKQGAGAFRSRAAAYYRPPEPHATDAAMAARVRTGRGLCREPHGA